MTKRNGVRVNLHRNGTIWPLWASRVAAKTLSDTLSDTLAGKRPGRAAA